MSQIGNRTLSRDDRAVSDRGKELRCPYLDENVVKFVESTSLGLLADLDSPPGCGDKRILREVARKIGLARHGGCADLQKRAIQFGSRIAKLSNQEHFGANRKGRGDALVGTDVKDQGKSGLH